MSFQGDGQVFFVMVIDIIEVEETLDHILVVVRRDARIRYLVGLERIIKVLRVLEKVPFKFYDSDIGWDGC